MSDFRDEILLSQNGLNWDDDLRYVINGGSDWRLNVVPTDEGSSFTLTNIKGNTRYQHILVHDVAYAGATYTCIGDCYDIKRNAVYLFIHSSLSNHSILRFNYTSKTFEKIVFDNLYLGFDSDHLIVDAFMIDDYLFYNPVTSSPRSVHVRWCTNYYDYDIENNTVEYDESDTSSYAAGDYFGRSGKIFQVLVTTASGHALNADLYSGPIKSTFINEWYYNPTDVEYFYNYAYQPTSPIYAEFRNGGYVYNNLIGKSFQFSYRYIFWDHRASLYAPYSAVYSRASTNSYTDETDDTSVDNVLFVMGAFSDTELVPFINSVESVEVVFRESGDDGWGDWKLAEVIPWKKIHPSYLMPQEYGLVYFYNDKSFSSSDGDIVIDQDEILLSHYSLPAATQSQWNLNGSRVVYGGNIDSYKLPDTYVTLSEVFREQELSQNLATIDTEFVITGGYDTITSSYKTGGFSDWGRTPWPKTHSYTWISYYSDIAIPEANLPADGYITRYTEAGKVVLLTKVAGWSIATFRTKLAQAISSALGPAVATATGVRRTFGKDNPYALASTCISYTTTTDEIYTTEYGFKSGAKHVFCLFYYDDIMRRSSAITSTRMELYLPFITEQTITTPAAIYNQSVQLALYHTPPEWAKYWSVGYAGNTSVGDFWQYTITSIADGTGTYADKSAININSLQRHKDPAGVADSYFADSNIELYSFLKGDRIRFIMKPGVGGATVPLATYEDYEIKDYQDDGTNAVLYIDKLAAYTIGARSLVEIYRPISTLPNTTFYETGPIYPMITGEDGIVYHSGNVQNQTASVPAKVNITKGDIYYITRKFAYPFLDGIQTLYPVETYSYSDFSDTKVWGKGKPGWNTGIGMSRSNTLRYSNQYFNQNGINGLSEFNGNDVVELSNTYGFITAIRQVGNMLNVYLERNTASLLVGMTELYQQDGVSQMWKTDDLLGNPNYSPFLYGTSHPESVRMIDQYVYFFDVYRSAYCRDATNGTIAVSGKSAGEADYKMETYFKEKSRELLTSGLSNTHVITSWDDDHGLVLVTFKDSVDSTHNETIGFHEGSNRWMSFYEFDSVATTPVTTTFALRTIYVSSSILIDDHVIATPLTVTVSYNNMGAAGNQTVYWALIKYGTVVLGGSEVVAFAEGESSFDPTITVPSEVGPYMLRIKIGAASMPFYSNEFDVTAT